jgi:hypothetical protein
MIDVTQYTLLTPAKSTLNVVEPLTLYYRNGEIITYENDSKTKIDLREVAGCQNKDFNLIFYNESLEYIKAAKKSEAFLQAIYNVFDFEVDQYAWCRVEQTSPLEFLDKLYLTGDFN